MPPRDIEPMGVAKPRAADRVIHGHGGLGWNHAPVPMKGWALAEKDGASPVPPRGRDDVPRGSVQRGAKLAGLPLGFAGRSVRGLARRIGGESAEVIGKQIQQRTADQVFRVLGELKGGAMKFGQAISIFEAALPPELA